MGRDQIVALRPAILQELIRDDGSNDVRADIVVRSPAVSVAEVARYLLSTSPRRSIQYILTR